MSARTSALSDPSSTAALPARQTYGQFTMKPPSGPWNSARAASSSAFDSDGPPTPLTAMRRMVEAARAPAGESMPSSSSSPLAPGFSMMWPPADSIRALMRTV